MCISFSLVRAQLYTEFLMYFSEEVRFVHIQHVPSRPSLLWSSFGVKADFLKKVPCRQRDEYLKFDHFYWWINVWFHSVPCLWLLLVQGLPSSSLHFSPRWKRIFNCIYVLKFCVSFFAVGPEKSISISKSVLS